MQQSYAYPQVFMVDGNPNCNPYVQAPVWTLPTLKKRRKWDCKTVASILILNLVLLALAWVALGTVYLIDLQKDIKEIKEDKREKSPHAEKIIGAQNVTEPPKNLKAAAHLTVGSYNNKGSNPLMWDDRLGHAFTRGVLYKDRGLFVNETGFFFVYSKIYFRAFRCEVNKNLEHVIFKRTNRYHKDLILMETKKTSYCSLNDKEWATNSYQAGIVFLSRGESLYVNVSYPKLVDSDESKTFFGLYKL
ncbi:tumor necrosis factor ligand superfamily member 6-like [Pristis pectinata]|uniref:tumor necrosis factor ligand superfamily member 6-like n=1 Tax=Pristis pectinata TaxID=685728 RepID=UPI00223D1D5D|nr:tumor necrosis factor ligand superfamily member 6-like [Pristis pectinata]